MWRLPISEEETSSQELIDGLIDADKQGRLIAHLCDLYLGRRDMAELAKTISDLHNQQNITLLSSTNIEAIEKLEHNDFWSVQYILTETIPTLESDTEQILQFAKLLIDKAGNDGVAYAPVSSLTTWCSEYPAQAHEIVEGTRRGEELPLFFGVSALKGMGDFELMDEFAISGENSLSKIGMKAMAISANEMTKENAKQALDRCFETLKKVKDAEVRLTAIDSAFRIWDDCRKVGAYLQREIIDHVVASDMGKEKQQLLSRLFYYGKGITKRSLTSILEYAATPSDQPEVILRLLDQALHGFNDRWNFEQVVAVFDAHMPQLPNEFDMRELHYFFDMVWTDSDKTSHIITTWFTRGDFTQCSKMVDAMNERTDKGWPVSIRKNHLPKDAADQIFIARKCIGFCGIERSQPLLFCFQSSKTARKTHMMQ